jgi:hypothetical protein
VVFQISAWQFDQLELSTFDTWVRLHCDILTDLVPEVAAAFPEPLFERRVEALLRRAELHGMWEQEETIPYCYASLTLGTGFETNQKLAWAPLAMALRGAPRGQAIWDGLEGAGLAGQILA